MIANILAFKKKYDTLPFLVHNSLERKDNPCKSYFTISDSQTF